MILIRDPVWQRSITRLIFVIVALLLIFAKDVAGMAAIWWNVSTYTHCLFIIPLVCWLIWQRRDEVMARVPCNYPPGLAFVFAGAMCWMIGQVAGVALFRHAGLIFMIQSSVLTVLGLQVTRGLLFPLFYLVFLIPFGDELIPMLQTITAKLCMVFLGWAGIPAHIEGVFISIPTGAFEVAEACSGVKFLVAMMAYATLAANVCFKSWPRRVGFMLMALVVPILANGVRAYGTIHISYVTGNNGFAESFDHIVFGWVFFAVILIVVMAIGWRFFDRGINDPWLEELPDHPVDPAKSAGWPIAVSCVALALAPAGWQAATASLGRVDVSRPIMLPEIANWKQVQIAQRVRWRPRFDGADRLEFRQYQNEKGDRVDLAVAVYGWQAEGKEIVGYAQGAFDPESRWSWANDTVAPNHGRAVRIFAPGVEREVLSFYRIGGITTGNPTRVKLATVRSKLVGRSQAAVAVLVSTETARNGRSRVTIDSFLRNLGPVDVLADNVLKTAEGH